jgi:basic amino acid/polyamine antiporter, APA family
MPQSHKIGLHSATAITVSAMVGTGVYTSLGFQVAEIPSVWVILLLWLVGGLVALSGALVYGEIGSVLEGSGGEYHYLSKLYHPVVGFMSGFTSATVGFAAPVALSSMAFGHYVHLFIPQVSDTWLASLLLLAMTTVQLLGIKRTAVFQRISTVANILLMLFFVVLGLSLRPDAQFDSVCRIADFGQVFTSAFAVSLVYVSYSYSGWNSSAYVAGEIENPSKNLPLSLLLGTCLVVLLYMSLHFVFLYQVPMSDLEGKLEIGFVVAEAMFGHLGGKIVAVMIALGLLASVSAMTFVGLRLTQTVLVSFGKTMFSEKSWPALLLQFAIAMLLIHTSTFQHVLTYIGCTLSLFTCLTVAGVFVLRKRFPQHTGFKTPLYPLTPLFFVTVNLLMMAYIFWEQTMQSLAGFGTALFAASVYGLMRLRSKGNTLI